MTDTLPSETKPCQKCAARMVAVELEAIHLSSPPVREWIWWCKCGHQQDGGVISLKIDRAERLARWERANKPSKKGD